MGTLYERINALCKSKGVSASRMCLDLGLSKSTMSDMKSGRTKGISFPTAQKVAGYFGITVDELYGEEEKSAKKEQPINIDGLSEKQMAFILKIMQMSDSEIDRVEKFLSLVENKG